MISFFKKDLLVFWRDRKEVLISLLSPILILIVLNFAFSGITFDDAGDMDINVGLLLEDDEAVGLEQFEKMLQDMNLPEAEIEAMMEQVQALSPGELMVSLFDDPELSSWVHIEEVSEGEIGRASCRERV